MTRKITRALARIALGLQDCLYLGNLDAKRDWGHARAFVRMQWMMLQQDEPDDFVIATGTQHSVREFVQKAASELGIGLAWQGEGVNETGIVDTVDENQFIRLNTGLNIGREAEISGQIKPGKKVVSIDPRYFRPTEVETLLGDPTEAREKLGWEPVISFQEMVHEMISCDLELAQRDELCRQAGFPVLNHLE